jgi:hypothetical protein
MKNRFLVFLLFLLVLISRLPFLSAGYGNDQDGWRVATAARYIATTGEYKASRLPGFPVVELTCSLLWKYGAWAMNLISALTSAVGVGVFFLIARHYGCRNPILLALTYAFTPIVFISSTITMDYMWTMMFVMSCWYACLKGKPVIAGLLLGAAIGCRITALAIALPFALLFFDKQNRKSSILNIITFWVVTGIGGAIAFLPVFFAYHTRFFTYFDQCPSIFIIVVKSITIDIWGSIGSCAVVAVPMIIFRNRNKNFESSIPKTMPREHTRLWIATIGLLVFEFIVFPLEGAYLIPAIPFFLLLIARTLTQVQLRIVCILIILSSFFFSLDTADRPWNPDPTPASMKVSAFGRTIVVNVLRGPVWNDYAQREKRIDYVMEVIRTGDLLDESSAFIVGPWFPYIIEMTPNALPESEFPDYFLQRKNVIYIPLLTPEFLYQFQHEGRRLYYLAMMDLNNLRKTKLDIKQAGVVELQVK